jgi:predicted adenylyl cyclase CyaB
MTEIEIKAHIPAMQPYFERAVALQNAQQPRYIHKQDIYYQHTTNADFDTEFRLRVENESRALVTRKHKHLDGGMEVNREIEFEVSDARQFSEFTQSLGYAERIRKEKKGYLIELGSNCRVELVEVTGLGFFAEIEILSTSDDPDSLAKARSRLYSILEDLGIGEDAIEPRYYTDMLISAR